MTINSKLLRTNVKRCHNWIIRRREFRNYCTKKNSNDKKQKRRRKLWGKWKARNSSRNKSFVKIRQLSYLVMCFMIKGMKFYDEFVCFLVKLMVRYHLDSNDFQLCQVSSLEDENESYQNVNYNKISIWIFTFLLIIDGGCSKFLR